MRGVVVWRERAVTLPLKSDDAMELVLEGVWQSGGPRGAVVAPPHPEYGGSLDNPVVSEVAFGLYQRGVASLRFNWRGVGGSQGQVTGDPAAAESDYVAALEHLALTVDGPFLGAGYSFGAAAALRVALRDPRLERLILVAPPAGMMESLPLAEFVRPLRVIVGGRDAFAPAARLSELLEPLPDARLEVIPEADHFFSATGLAELVEFVRAALD